MHDHDLFKNSCEKLKEFFLKQTCCLSPNNMFSFFPGHLVMSYAERRKAKEIRVMCVVKGGGEASNTTKESGM